MATVHPTLMTADEFYQWTLRAENRNKRVELDRGEIIEMPPPGELHGVICSLISHILWGYVHS